MITKLKSAVTAKRVWQFFSFFLLIGAGVALGPRLARSDGQCGCHNLITVSENFDGVTPPALPAQWLATTALGPPPLWVTSNAGVPSPPADTLPNAAFIDDPGVLTDKRLDSLPL